ncbi:hypothetical protein INT43_003335 [Umbelopsis isabellina]|uniref:Fe2OG dioxygenase domain-containing protein n=1 Tax=Mortierella isabellina TaxID=91625 RepID=A0A8H7PQ10_MORIS|nr:hypothetical protein INT43_003335 [Umbelopsis isabellina]
MSNESVDNVLTDRILRAVSKQEKLPEFPDEADDLPSDYEYDPDAEEEVEEVEEISENELLEILEQESSALDTARLLFNEDKVKEADTLSLDILSPQSVRDLYETGSVVLDNVVDKSVIQGTLYIAYSRMMFIILITLIYQAAHDEASVMQNNGEFQPAQEYRQEGDDQYRDNKARDDRTVWLNPADESKESSRPKISQLLKMLQHKLLQDLSQIIHLNGNVEYQLAYYHPQNARYERHRDAFPTSEREDTTQRRVTAIIYLNPDWVQGDGGELRLFGKNSAPHQDVEPIASRLVVFLSGVVDHAVISASKPRYALTAWIR